MAPTRPVSEGEALAAVAEGVLLTFVCAAVPERTRITRTDKPQLRTLAQNAGNALADFCSRGRLEQTHQSMPGWPVALLNCCGALHVFEPLQDMLVPDGVFFVSQPALNVKPIGVGGDEGGGGGGDGNGGGEGLNCCAVIAAVKVQSRAQKLASGGMLIVISSLQVLYGSTWLPLLTQWANTSSHILVQRPLGGVGVSRGSASPLLCTGRVQ